MVRSEALTLMEGGGWVKARMMQTNALLAGLKEYRLSLFGRWPKICSIEHKAELGKKE